MWRFAKAVLLGALAAAALPMVLTTGVAAMMLPEVARGAYDAGQVAYVLMLPLIVALPVVLAAALIVGLPTTAFLKWRGWESRAAYLASGIGAGTVIPIAVLGLMRAPSGYWIALLGAFGGGVAAHVWWSSFQNAKVERPVKLPSFCGAAALLLILAVMWVLKGDLKLAAFLAVSSVALAGSYWFTQTRR